MKKEQVLVVPSKHVGIGFHYSSEEDLYRSIGRYVEFMDREMAEKDEDFRQIVPYNSIINTRGEIALFRRNKGEEERLKNKFTVGIGGHINPKDFTCSNSLELKNEVMAIVHEGIVREMEEEVVWRDILILKERESNSFVGIIEVQDETPVEKVHLGIYYRVFIDDIEVIETNGDELLFEGWFAPKNILLIDGEIEKWSLEVIEYEMKSIKR